MFSPNLLQEFNVDPPNVRGREATCPAGEFDANVFDDATTFVSRLCERSISPHAAVLSVDEKRSMRRTVPSQACR